MIEQVKRFLGLSRRKTGNKIVISVEKLERRVALLEDGQLEEYSVERDSSRNIAGSVYKGRVKNIEPGLKAMFVDIGLEKNAFLHFWDAIPAALDSGIEEIERPERPDSKRPKKRLTAKDIPSIYPVGSEVIVQVTKGPIGTKGPRVSTNLSFAGRYLVLMPFSDRSGISRKIEDPKERARLRKILRELDIPEGLGVIIRTVGEGQRARYFVRDLSFLLEQWSKIEQQIKELPAPARVFEEPDLVDRTVRDFLTDEIDEVVCDDHAAVERMVRHGRRNFAAREKPNQILRRHRADLRDLRRAEANRRCFSSPGLAEMRRLYRDRRNRSARRGGCKHRSQQRWARRRENDSANQSRSGRRNRAPASAAQYRRSRSLAISST